VASRNPFPAVSSKAEPTTKQALEMLTGHIGDIRTRAVTFGDLEEMGEITINPAAYKKGANVANSPSSYVATVSLSDKPVTPTGLTTTPGWSSVLLAWDAPAYRSHSHTEIWRADVDDRAQASLIHTEGSSSWADMIGQDDSKFYWIRHVSEGGTASGFNQLAGTQGSTHNDVDIDAFFLSHPELREQPFSIVNVGTEAEPVWRFVLNGTTLINGNLGINQLQSGELPTTTTLTVGQGSLQMGTSSDGTGEIIITGSGGIASNNYMRINEGTIESFVYDPAQGHVPYKEVRRIERGTANSGTQVIIPGYYKSAPSIYLTPNTIVTYNADPAYAGQSQQWRLAHTAPAPVAGVAGSWAFTPTAVLELSDGTNTVAYPEESYSGSSNSHVITITNQTFVKGFTINARAISRRNTGSSGVFQNRSVQITVEYALTGSGNWTVGGTDTADFDSYNDDLPLTVEVTGITQGDYDVRITYTASDDSGTYNYGGTTYEYATDNATAANISLDSANDSSMPSDGAVPSDLTDDGYISVTRPSGRNDWELLSVDWSFNWNVTLESWRVVWSSSGFPNNFATYGEGESKSTIPYVSDKTLQHASSTHNTSNYLDATDYRNDVPPVPDNYGSRYATSNYSGSYNSSINVNGSNSSWLHEGKASNTKAVATSEAVIDYTDTYGGHKVFIARSKVNITDVSAAFNYRKPAAVSTSPDNQFHLTSIVYDKGAVSIVPTGQNIAINWLSAGE
jgi:hypothetical protein